LVETRSVVGNVRSVFDLQPRAESVVTLANRRRIGISEFGDPHGRAVLWFHGTPGGSRQIPLEARRIAAELGARLVLVERPGIGRSTPHLYRNIADSTSDIDELTDRLGIDRFAVAALSGGGPYAMACAANLAERVVAVAILGGVAPSRGFEAVAGGLVGFATRFAPLLEVARVPLGHSLWAVVQLARPFGSLGVRAYAAISPEGDKRVFERADMRAMFLDDLTTASRRQFHAAPADVVLFVRDWGFRIGEISVPVRFWHGDSDNIVPLSHAEHMAALVPDSQLTVRGGESHLGGLDAAREVLVTLLDLWDRRP
jgi:pimeloyl-ACP methyl ester carboxylesterase